MNLTASQAKALETMKANGGTWSHFNQTFTVHATALNSLVKKGLARYEGSYETHDFRIVLTQDENSAAAGARAEGKRLGMTDAQIERFISRMS